MNHAPIPETADRLKNHVKEMSGQKQPGLTDFDVTPFVIPFMADEGQPEQKKE